MNTPMLWIAASLWALLGPPGAGVASEHADRGALEQVALTRARTALRRLVLDLPLTHGVTIGHWAAQDVDRDRALRRWLYAIPRATSPRWYSDGVCEVDARVDPEALSSLLLKLSSALGATNDSIAERAQRWPVLRSTGTAGAGERPHGPPGWEDIAPVGVRLAGRAARAAAVDALMQQIAQLQITPGVRVRAFFQADESIAPAVREALERAVRVKLNFAVDQVACAGASIDMPELIRILTRVCAEHYHGQRFQSPAFREMVLSAPGRTLSATGLAVAPERYRTQAPTRPSNRTPPRWAARTLRATGRYVPAPGDGFVEPIRIALARLDATARLDARVRELELDERTTVAALLDAHNRLEDDLALLLSGARVTDIEHDQSGAVTVHLELPLMRLWQIVAAVHSGSLTPARRSSDASARPILPNDGLCQCPCLWRPVLDPAVELRSA